MKYAHLYTLLVMLVCTADKEQNKTFLQIEVNSPAVTFKSEANDKNIWHGQTSITTNRANFSGNWKLNVSKSETGRFGVGDKVCLDWLAASKTMKIAGHANFLTIDLVGPSGDGALVTRQEKLTFDGKEYDVDFLGRIRKKSVVKWSDNGQTMNVNSVLYYTGEEIKVSEVWKLINNGKSISLRSNSNSVFGENIMKLIYDKAN